MALMGRTEIGLRKTGSYTSVPNDPKAKLMYYLSCICNLIDLDNSDADIRRLRDYPNYWLLSEDDVTSLIVICIALKPDELMGKLLFANDEMCGNSSNEFYELSAVNHTLMVTDSVLIGGQRKRVQKIMTFRMSWLMNNYINPMKTLLERRSAAQRRAEERRRRESGCSVM